MKIKFALYDGSAIFLNDESEVSENEGTTMDDNKSDSLTGSEPESAEYADTSGITDVDSAAGGEVGTATDIVGSADRPILTTPLDEYTVTEGLLLITVLILALGGIISMFRGR